MALNHETHLYWVACRAMRAPDNRAVRRAVRATLLLKRLAESSAQA